MNSLTPAESKENIVTLLLNKSILTEKDFANFNSCKAFIIDTYMTVPMYRPLVVKMFGVLGDPQFSTLESKYWQCKTEAETHANELIREMHDLEKLKINIDRSEYILNNKMKSNEPNEELNFDRRELAVNISLLKFEFAQLEKKIKYRIEEVTEWKKISDSLSSSKEFNPQTYAQMLLVSLENKWDKDLENPLVKDDDKVVIKQKLDGLRKVKSQPR